MVFPAPAGVIPGGTKFATAQIGFPRTCGGDPIIMVNTLINCGFSPHLRG